MDRSTLIFRHAVAAALLLGAFLVGCTQGPPAEVSIVAPKVGSVYTYTRSDLDSAHRPIPGTDTTVTATVVAADTTMYGMKNVYKILESMSFWYLHYESNGDVSMCFDWGNSGPFPPRWVLLPFATGIPQSIVLVDTTVHLSANPLDTAKIKFVADTKKVGTDTMMIGSQKILTERVQLTITTVDNGVSNATTLNLDFAPKAGFFALKEDGFVDRESGKHQTRVQKLKSFALK